MRIVQFGTLSLTPLDGRDQFEATGRRTFAELSGGAFDMDGQQYVPESTRLSRRFIAIDSETQTIQEQLDAISAELAKGRALLIATTRDGDRRQTWAKGSRLRASVVPGTWGQQPFEINWEIDYPFWVATADEPWYLDSGELLDAGLSLDSGNSTTLTIDDATESLTITNNGGARIDRGYLALEVQAASSASAITISNAANQMAFTITDSLTVGDLIIIEFLPMVITKNDDDAFGILSIPNNQWLWMSLEQGDNDLTITTSNLVGTIELEWWYARQWLI